MGLFTNPLGHAGYPPGVTGTPSTQPSAVRAATAVEVAAGVVDNAYITPNSLSNGSLGDLSVTGNISTLGAGNGFRAAEGSNAKQGVAVLVGGTVVVANTSVTADSRIFLTAQDLGTVGVPSALGVSARTAGASFTILASQGTDTSTVAYEIFEPVV